MKMNYQPGDIIKNQYEIIRKFDDGNQGKTFLAKDLSKNRDCVVKYLGVQDITANQRFQNEARILETSKHDRIPKFLDHFDFDGGQYLVQQYIEGPNLKQIIQKYGKLSEFEVTCLLEQVLNVLDYIHSQKIIHRDIKPANLVWRSKLEKIDIVLIDFGIIKEIGNDWTNAGPIGSPPYISPEQWERQPVTIRSDIYSLGRTAIEALTGKSPEITNSETIWLPQEVFTPGLQNILNRMEKSNPEERYQSAKEVLDDIHNLKSSICTLLERTYSYKVLENLECPIFGYDYLAKYISNSSSSRFIIKQLKPISTDRFTIDEIIQELKNKKELLNRIGSNKNKRRRIECLYDETTKNLFFCVELIESQRDRVKPLSEMCLSEVELITDAIKDVPNIQKRSIPPSSDFNQKLQLQYFLLFVKRWSIVPILIFMFMLFIIALGFELYRKQVNDNAIDLYNEGKYLAKKGESQKAIETYDKVLKSPFFTQLLIVNKPLILVAKSVALGQIKPSAPISDRLELCEQALNIEPEFTGALNCKGQMLNEYKEYKEYQKAIALFDQVIKLELSKPEPTRELMLALYNKGYAHEQLKEPDKAREAFEAALQEANKRINQNPNNSDAITIRDRSQSKLLQNSRGEASGR